MPLEVGSGGDEGRAVVPPREFIVFEHTAHVVEELLEAKAKLAELEAKQEHQRALKTARMRRWRQSHREHANEYNAEYMRQWRARKREEES